MGSCGKENQKFPDVPFIRYEGFEQIRNLEGKDSIGVLKLYFTDGDGDLGLDPADTFPPFNRGSLFYYNFIIDYFEKQNGTYVKVVVAPPIPGADTITNNSRIPRLVAQGRNRSLEGMLMMELFTNNPLSTFDTIKYRAYIIDRALNKSNTIETPELIIRK